MRATLALSELKSYHSLILIILILFFLDISSNSTHNLAVNTSAEVTDNKYYTVQLHKKEEEILGVTIVGGEDSKRITPGIFIKSIKPDTVAAKDGRIIEGIYKKIKLVLFGLIFFSLVKLIFLVKYTFFVAQADKKKCNQTCCWNITKETL